MLRHAIAPARHFCQVPNDIIRHPRLSSDAVRLLTWQLSLPASAKDSLSRTAERAGIGKCAFLKAKRELKAEGFLHEWREQGVRGLWTTVQLVSNVPLTAEEAADVRASGTGGVPAGGCPAAGEPSGRGVGGYPENPVRENIPSVHPVVDSVAGPGRGAVAPSEVSDLLVPARQVVESLPELDSRLCVPRGMVPELVRLVAEWLDFGHTVDDVRECLRRALPGREQRVHRPGGLVRYVLRDVPPVVARAEVVAPGAARVVRVPRVAQMRECEGGGHVQPMLFRPVGDERLCRACRGVRASGEGERGLGGGVGALAVRGAAVVREVLRERAVL